SRRRHTSFSRDWSSDVCSSDLLAQQFAKLPMEYRKPFEDMGVSSEDTQPALVLPPQLRAPARTPAPPVPPPGSPTITVDPSLERSEERRVGNGGRDAWRPPS